MVIFRLWCRYWQNSMVWLLQSAKNSGLIYEPLNITYGALIDKLRARSRNIIALLIEHGFDEEKLYNLENLEWYVMEAANLRSAQQICCYICNNIYPNLMLTSQERENLLRGLEGQYIEPGPPCGAPSSGGVDSITIGNFLWYWPEKSANSCCMGNRKTLGDQVIERYISEEGRYPESVGIVLWSGANMRSHGHA